VRYPTIVSHRVRCYHTTYESNSQSIPSAFAPPHLPSLETHIPSRWSRQLVTTPQCSVPTSKHSSTCLHAWPQPPTLATPTPATPPPTIPPAAVSRSLCIFSMPCQLGLVHTNPSAASSRRLRGREVFLLGQLPVVRVRGQRRWEVTRRRVVAKELAGLR
jgi:hypothetical protein